MAQTSEINLDSDDRIYPIIVREIYRRAKIGIIGTIVNASILVAILWKHVSPTKLILWFILTLLLLLIRFILTERFNRVTDPTQGFRWWGQIFTIGFGLSGMLWGSTAIFLFPAESIAHQAFIAFVLAGMVAGAAGAFAALMPVFLAFSIPALAPLFIRFVSIGDELHWAMALMTALFAVLTFSTARRVNHSTREFIALKETFAEQLEERTAELKQVNEKLRQEADAHRQAEAEKAALERQMRHTQKLESLGVLAGGIAHDFNNILTAILGNTDMALARLNPTSIARDNLIEIEKASLRAADLAKQMLAYSGKGRFIVKPVDARELIEEMAHLLEVTIPKKAVLKYNFDDNLTTFNGDETQLRQVIMNLITNAAESLEEGEGVITLSAGARKCDRPYLNDIDEVLRASMAEPLAEGMYTYFEVSDTGCGMDAETIEKIFDPFFTTKFTGRGLGMSAVLGIVRGHKGALKIDSEVGKGTTFTVLFPANPPFAKSRSPQKTERVARGHWQGNGTVLLADDEETVLSVGKQMFQRLGFRVLTASDGRAALQVFREHKDEIVCVFLDLTMPRMDGEAAFHEMRRIHPGITVILCSGYNEQDATQRFAGQGLAGFIQKPYNMAALQEKLMEVLPMPHSPPEPTS